MSLAAHDAAALARQIAAIEARTGVQVVAAVVDRCDRYPEARWKAFALGVSLAAFAVALADALRPDWAGAFATLGALVAVLGAGALNALAAHFLPRYARHFVRDNRAEAEAKAYAEALFLRRGLFATPARTAILLVVARYERSVVLHADVGYAGRIAARDWDGVVAPMTAALRAGDTPGAFGAGLNALGALLERHGFAGDGSPSNVFADAPVEERGR
jgi:uncharacterized membrane protein